jgi:predicted GIY-YIG superfamily endonuclease
MIRFANRYAESRHLLYGSPQLLRVHGGQQVTCALEHKNDVIEGFSRQYKCHRLVYYESFDDATEAINREKQLKRWNRTTKTLLIEGEDPTWEDLAAEWFVRHRYAPEKQVSPLAS